jgi:hypothetical protein
VFAPCVFNSGYALPDLGTIACRRRDTIVIDGYHGFSPFPPTGPISVRFYMAGGQDAMSGEGACFLHVPVCRLPRPRDTGWFAASAPWNHDDGAAWRGARASSRHLRPRRPLSLQGRMDWFAVLA